jgi:hypothetical protein
MSDTTELRAEVAQAVARLTQILTSGGPARRPPNKVRMRDGSDLTQWISTPDAEVLTDDDPCSVLLRGPLICRYMFEDDLYAMSPTNAIALGHALIAAANAATVDNVVAIGVKS